MKTLPIRPTPTLRLLAAIIAAVLLLGGCGAPEGPGMLLESLPSALLDRGALWRADGGGQARLVALLGLAEDAVDSTLVTGPPAVSLLAVSDTGGVAASLEDAGYVAGVGVAELGVAESGAADGWTILVRDVVDERTVGVPAVGVTDGLVVIGSPEEIAAVIAQHGSPGTAVPVELLAGATIALVGTPATAATRAPAGLTGALPAYEAFVMSGGDGGAGVVALAVTGAEQSDAVALSVRVSTTLLDGGMAATTLMRPGEPLSVGDRVILNVEWLVDAETVLGAGLDGGLAGLLHSP